MSFIPSIPDPSSSGPSKPSRSLPSSSGQDGGTGSGVPGLGDGQLGIASSQIVSAVRRSARVVVACVILGALVAAGLSRLRSEVYRGTAVLRLVGDRAVLTDEGATPTLGSRSIDPLLSTIQGLRSRTVVGQVVDSLGLRLEPVTPSLVPDRLLGRRSLRHTALGDVRVSATASDDTLRLRFSPESVRVSTRADTAAAEYGAPVDIAGVRLVVRGDPAVRDAQLALLPRDAAIDRVLEHLTVSPRTGTNVVDVRYTSPEPAMAQAVVNGVVQSFLAVNVRWAQESAKRRREFLDDQLRQVDSQLALAQERLAAFRSRHQISGTQERLSAEQGATLELDLKREEVEAERRVYGAMLDRLARERQGGRRAPAVAGYPPEIAADPAVGALLRQLVDYRGRLDSLTGGRWGREGHNPDVAQLRSLAAATESELNGALRSRLFLLEQRAKALESLRARHGATMRTLPALQVQEMQLSHRTDALTTLSEQLRQEYEKAKLAQSVEAGDMAVMDLASLPYRRAGLSGGALTLMGGLAGLVLGLLFALVAEARDRSIRRPEELEWLLQIPELGVIPNVGTGVDRLPGPVARRLAGGMNGKPTATTAGTALMDETVVSALHPLAPGSEAFRMLRTSIGWLQADRPLHVVLVTSALPGEGKTVTAANLAATCAREGARVLLVDADMRRGRLHKVFGMPRGPGLSELLDERGEIVHLESAYSLTPNLPTLNGRGGAILHARATGVEGLSLLPCGTPRSAALAPPSRQRLGEVLGRAATAYDLVVVDAPPALATADATALAGLADAVLFVVRAAHTDRRATERAYQQVVRAGGHVVGAVLNDPSGSVARYADYYQYQYQQQGDSKPT